MTIKDTNLTINVKDMDQAISFYQSIGFAVKNRWENYYAQLTAPGIVIGLHPTRENNLTGGSGNTSIGFTTDDLEEAKSHLQKLAIPVTTRDEEGGQFLHFSDPDGTSLYFIKPKW
ncbi:MAG TPA: VOC family protein [Chitinophagales bacterium]|nr:VOC family protein [Chitinophagales bacterium]